MWPCGFVALSTYRLPRGYHGALVGARLVCRWLCLAVLGCAGPWAGGWTLVPVGRWWAGGRSCARWWLLDSAGCGVVHARAPVRPRALLVRHKSGVGDWIINKVEFIKTSRKFYKNYQKFYKYVQPTVFDCYRTSVRL